MRGTFRVLVDVAEEYDQQRATRLKPRLRRARELLVNVLIAVMTPAVFLASAVLFVQMGKEIPWLPRWFDHVDNFFGLNFETPARPLALLAFVLILYISAYSASFDFLATKRPVRRMLFLHALIAVIPAFLAVAAFDLTFTAVNCLMVLALVAGYPAAAWGAERLLSRGVSALGQILLMRENYHLGTVVLHLAILLAPEQTFQRKMLGAARFEAGDVLGTLAVLEPLVDDNCQDMPMLEALEECYRTEKMWDKVLGISRMRLALQPKRASIRVGMARVLERLKRYEEAVQVLREGMPTTSLDYLEQMIADLLELRDCSAAVEIVRQMEALEPSPQPRSLKAYRDALKLEPNHQGALEGMADLLIRNNSPDEGHRVLEQIVEMNPDRHDVRKRLVQFYQERGLLDRAEPHLLALMDAAQETADVTLLYGDILFQREEYDKALLHFQFAVEQYPDDYRFAYFLAQIAFRTQALEEALRWLDEASQKQIQPEDRTRIQTLRRRVEDSMVNRELRVMQERCDRDLENMDLRLSYIREMTRHGMAERAIAEYDTLLEERPELKPRIIAQLEDAAKDPHRRFRLMDYLSDLKIKDRLWDEALDLAREMAARSMHGDRLLTDHTRRILSRNPDHVPSLRCLGEILTRQENWKEALEIYGHYQELARENDEAVRRAVFLANANLKNADQAIETGEAFLRDYNHDVDTRLRLVHVYLDLERYDEAYQHLQRAQSADYYNAEVTRLMREVAQLRRTQQIERLLKTLENNPNNAAAQMEVGDLYVAVGETKKAIPYLQRAAQEPPLRSLALAKLANAMARLHMFDLAEETLDEVKLSVEEPERQTQLKILFFDTAEIFECEDQPERALKFYKRIFRIDASFRNVVDKIEALGG